ncbi:RidA family protein [Nocardia sp. NPDC050175]|uniref:RidA family protein n=1 Tax=Nocardia sp. NPDC050175 TaxID=3364317 RepID=UPI0037A9EC7C
MRVLQPPGWPRPRGYANGIAARGEMVFVAGMIGWDTEGVIRSPDIADQVRQTLRNIVAVLAEAGAEPTHIVRMTWYVTDVDAYVRAYREIGVVFREIIGDFRAAMTAVEVSRLVEPGAKVEIEVTAVIPDPPQAGAAEQE